MTTLSLKNRRKLGLALVAASVLAATIIQFRTGDLVQSQTVSETQPGSKPYQMMVLLTVNWRYGFPLAACGLLGIICFLWPERKPPRLAS